MAQHRPAMEPAAAETRLHNEDRQPLHQLYADREPGLERQRPALADDIGLLLRTLGGTPARTVELSAQRLLLPQLWLCRRRQIPAGRTELPDGRSLLRPLRLLLRLQAAGSDRLLQGRRPHDLFPRPTHQAKRPAPGTGTGERRVLHRRPPPAEHGLRIPVQPPRITPPHRRRPGLSLHTGRIRPGRVDGSRRCSPHGRRTRHGTQGNGLQPQPQNCGTLQQGRLPPAGLLCPGIQVAYREGTVLQLHRHPGRRFPDSLPRQQAPESSDFPVCLRRSGIRGTEVPGQRDGLCQLPPQHDRAGGNQPDRRRETERNREKQDVPQSDPGTHLGSGLHLQLPARPDPHRERRLQLFRPTGAIS